MKVFGLIGFPLGHSFSKKYFTEKFQQENLPYTFENFPIADIHQLPDVLATPGLSGLCVTIPYKQLVIPYLHTKSDAVEQIGACNSIYIKNGRLTGNNTDTIGFKTSLLKQLQPHHKKALILGTGGAAKAVAYVLRSLGIEFTYVSRTESENVLSYAALKPAVLEDAPLVINASPVGTFPNAHEKPSLPYEAVTAQHFLFDLVYNPEKTLFLKEGEQRGAIIQNGYEMLVEQAEASWRIWNDIG